MSYQQPPTKKSNTGLWIGGAAILLVAVIAVVVLLLNRPSAPAAPAAAVIVSAETATVAPPTATPIAVNTPTPASTETPTSTPIPELGTSNLFIEYILDASGSMSETLSDGSPKIEVAQRVLTEHMRSFRPETNVGLRVYGHRLPYQQTDESCRDIELIAPPEKGQMERIVTWLQDFTVQGMTPLAASLELAKDDFIYDASRINSIVMLSDGIETCGGDPCRLVEELKAEGINFTIHVIGLDVDDPTRQQLTCIAEAGGGTYHDTRSQEDLSVALAAVKADVTRDEVVVPPGVDTPTPAPTNTPVPMSEILNQSSWIAYIGTDDKLWLLAPETGQRIELISLGTGHLNSPAWSPDGSELALTIRGARPDIPWGSMAEDLMVLNIDSKQLRSIRLADLDNEPYVLRAVSPAWSADGKYIYYATTTDSLGRYWNLRQILSDGTGVEEVPPMSDDRWHYQGNPAASPNGQWITFALTERHPVVQQPPSNWGIWRTQVDRSDSKRLVTGLNGNTAWSPDSALIAYDNSGSKATPVMTDSIHLMDASGSYIRQLTENGSHPSWSPDGTQVAFVRKATTGTPEIWIVSVDGSNVRRLTDGSAPAWRPTLATPSD